MSAFIPSPATSAEISALRDGVSVVVDDNVDKITQLLSRLSSEERAQSLFDHSCLINYVRAAQRVIELQEPKTRAPAPESSVPADAVSETESQPEVAVASSVQGKAKEENSTNQTLVASTSLQDADSTRTPSKRLELLTAFYLAHDIVPKFHSMAHGSHNFSTNFEAFRMAQVNREDTPSSPTLSETSFSSLEQIGVPEPQIPGIVLDPGMTPLECSQALYAYSIENLQLREWDCGMASPPAFPANFDPRSTPRSSNSKPVALVVWRGTAPGVYGFYGHSRGATEMIRHSRYHGYNDVKVAFERWNTAIALGNVIFRLLNAGPR